MEGDCLRVRGSLFHSMEDATVKVLSPVCFRLVRFEWVFRASSSFARDINFQTIRQIFRGMIVE